MPRNPTTDLHAELAVDLYNRLLDENGWELDHSWLAISKLLMSCEIWQQGIWGHLHDVSSVGRIQQLHHSESGRDSRQNHSGTL